MVHLSVVVGLCSWALTSAETSPGSLHVSPFAAALRKPSFLEAPSKPSKELPKAAPKLPSKEVPMASAPVAAKTAVKAASKPHANGTSVADDILHPKVEYDPETAALMKQADDAIKEAESTNDPPPKPVKKKDPKAEKDEEQNMGMIKALRSMVCGHKLKKHLQLCELHEFQGAEIKAEVHPAAIPDADTSVSESPPEDGSVASRADDLMAKVDSLQKSVASSLPEDAKSALLDVVHDASQVSKKHTTGAEAMALMKSDVTASLPASVRDTILSVMKEAKAPAPSTPSTAMTTDVTAGLPPSVRNTVLAVMKDAKH